MGEHIPALRERLVKELAWLGAELDPAANQRCGPCLTTPNSRLPVLMMATGEEQVLAIRARDLLALGTAPAM